MARFPIQRAPERLGVVPTTAVRADIDVRTGERELAGAAAGLGGAIADLGGKYYDIQATTQLSRAERLAVEEMNRLSISLQGNLDPETYLKEYEKSLETIQKSTGTVLTNEMAVANFELFLNDRQPRWENSVKKAQKSRILDNRLEEIFNRQTAIGQSGIYGNFSEFIAETIRDVDGFEKSDGARIIAQTKKMAATGTELNRINTFYETAKKLPIKQALEFLNDAPDLTREQRNDLIARRKRQEEIAAATTNRKVRWDVLRKVTKNPQSIIDEYLESLVKPNSLTWDDAEELKKIRDDASEPLKTPRAQLYFNSLDALFDKRDTDSEERMKWDIANEKLVQFFKDNPKATAKQAAEFYDELIAPEVSEWVEWFGKLLRPKETTPFWRHFGTTEEAALARKKAPEPKTIEEFNETVGNIEDDEKAKAYYEKWKDKW